MTLPIISLVVSGLALVVSVALYTAAKRQADANEKMVEEMKAQREMQWRPYLMVRNIEEGSGYWIQVLNTGRGPALTCAVVYLNPAGIFEVMTHLTLPSGDDQKFECLPRVTVAATWMLATVRDCKQRLGDKHFPFVLLCQDEFGACLRFVEGIAKADEWHSDSEVPRPDWVDEGWTAHKPLSAAVNPEAIVMAPVER